MYKNIKKDMFTIKETQKYVNLKWNDIKGTSPDSDAYLSSNAQLKKYYNSNEDFHQALLNLIKNKYFKDAFSSLDISYNQKSIYKSDNFAETNKKYLIVNNFDEQNAIVVNQEKDREKISKILLGEQDVIKDTLKKEVFNSLALQRNRKKYEIAQNKFLNSFLTSIEVENYKLSDSYLLAIAMGYADFIGPIIKIGEKENSYMHKLPDFKLAISYSLNGENDEISESLLNLSLNLFNVYKKVWGPNKVNQDSYLFNINYDQKRVWDNFWYNTVSYYVYQKTINNFLNRYSDFYNENLKKELNALNITKNVFDKENIISYNFGFSFTDSKEIRQTFFTNANASDKFFLKFENFKSDSSGNNWSNVLEYLKFNLFGIIEMKIFLNKNLNEAIFF
ncbi:hypothetical protein [Spiroplasma floricola]|uniref:Uncharacterized protein n=1 Tax=Spiroplasma floricola 23-6 TaxID=1336749 RepID=A0A2K8SDN5_9MOLU|nr:hypothetical protein [Spiroplasma floricola]AUB31348.1 hypothetical protein SFLOR_v1c02910 [Spiroplasma floricola 23-6]